jgi:hypothetical protein
MGESLLGNAPGLLGGDAVGVQHREMFERRHLVHDGPFGERSAGVGAIEGNGPGDTSKMAVEQSFLSRPHIGRGAQARQCPALRQIRSQDGDGRTHDACSGSWHSWMAIPWAWAAFTTAALRRAAAWSAMTKRAGQVGCGSRKAPARVQAVSTA